MKSSDNILEIGIEDTGQLYIKPETEQFTLIYRSATEVHWDTAHSYLYSPKPKEWTYLMWYKHIISVIENECGCKLNITSNTNWHSIPDDLKQEIIGTNT